MPEMLRGSIRSAVNLTTRTVNLLQPTQLQPSLRKGPLVGLLQLKEKVRKIRGDGQSVGRNRVSPGYSHGELIRRAIAKCHLNFGFKI